MVKVKESISSPFITLFEEINLKLDVDVYRHGSKKADHFYQHIISELALKGLHIT